MRSVRSLWLKRLVLASALAAAIGWLPWQVYGHTGLSRLARLKGELATLRHDNEAVRAENARLRAEILLYDEDDVGAIERVARDELGLVKPGELVFKVEETP